MSSFLKEAMPAAKIIKVYMKAINQRRIRQKYITTILIFIPTDLLRVSFMLLFSLIYQQAFCLFFQLNVFCARWRVLTHDSFVQVTLEIMFPRQSSSLWLHANNVSLCKKGAKLTKPTSIVHLSQSSSGWIAWQTLFQLLLYKTIIYVN